ncbi:MAG: hypothetical protein A2075_00760 [Geobacteraceae bacterium GWC2_58_44]|nr:MAG: hypothetical protein A2075_00760 [Geobacteraceae bacterium GWC2_58_44]HBG06226.1 hypothetical protein [Geobacter sp.]
MPINAIVSQFAEEAAFLWFLRSKAVSAPHFSLRDLTELDERLEAQIDGLRVAGDAGWALCRDALQGDHAEGVFPAAVLAFENGKETPIGDVMNAVSHDQGRSRPLISALGWLSYEKAQPHIKAFLTDESSFHRYIGIAASAIHRHDPGLHLNKAASDPSPLVKARGLRAYGELGRSRELDLSGLRDDLTADDDGVRFSAAWSATLAGNTETVELLKSFVIPESHQKEKALNAALRRMELTNALSWQKSLSKSEDTIRLAVIGTGIIGDSLFVPWLIEQMNTPVLARVAGESFTMITGVDIALEMEDARPDGFEAGPNDDPRDHNIAMDADEDLSWPNVESISAWWNKNKGDYPSGIRYLLGKPVSVDHLRQILRTGRQRQRSAAALELAMMNPGQPLFEVRAPAFRQSGMRRNL